MARILAIEWDDLEIRIAVGNVRGDDVTIEEATHAALDLPEEEKTEQVVGDRLAALLEHYDLAKMDALVAIGRGNIELRTLTLPPASPEDRPDLVRFQAQRAFTSLGENCPIDYVELETTEDQSVKVLAAALSSSIVKQIHSTCAVAEITPKRLTLRQFAAASVLRRGGVAPGGKCVLAVDVLTNDADLTVLVDGDVVFMRTVKLPSTKNDQAMAKAMLGEIRRTIVAANNQIGTRRVESVVICGDEQNHAVLQAAASDALEQPVEVFDPFSAVTLGRSLRQAQPERPGRFAPLLGMLLDEAQQEHTIDFLNPRRRPDPPSKAGRNLTLAGAAALVVILLAGGLWLVFRSYDAEIQRLTDESASRESLITKATEWSSHADKIDKFEASSVTWMDELAMVANQLPPAEDAIITDLTISTYNGPGGRLNLKGYVRDSSDIRILEDSLRYNNNDVAGKRGTIDPSQSEYMWMFDVTMTVPPDPLDRGRPQGRGFDLADMKASVVSPDAEEQPTRPIAMPGGDDEPAEGEPAEGELAEQAVVAQPAETEGEGAVSGDEDTNEDTKAGVEGVTPEPEAAEPAGDDDAPRDRSARAIETQTQSNS